MATSSARPPGRLVGRPKGHDRSDRRPALAGNAICGLARDQTLQLRPKEKT